MSHILFLPVTAICAKMRTLKLTKMKAISTCLLLFHLKFYFYLFFGIIVKFKLISLSLIKYII